MAELLKIVQSPPWKWSHYNHQTRDLCCWCCIGSRIPMRVKIFEGNHLRWNHLHPMGRLQQLQKTQDNHRKPHFMRSSALLCLQSSTFFDLQIYSKLAKTKFSLSHVLTKTFCWLLLSALSCKELWSIFHRLGGCIFHNGCLNTGDFPQALPVRTRK